MYPPAMPADSAGGAPDEPDIDSGALVINARLIALGKVVEWSASMEYVLRDTFCSLVGSKYAAVVAGGQGAEWLIIQCKALLDVHHEMTDEQRGRVRAALQRCSDANQRRNILVHGVKTASRASDGALSTVRSRRNRHQPDIEPWTPATIEQAAGELVLAGGDLRAAMFDAVTPEIMVIADALGWEDRRRGQSASGHDVDT